VPADGKSATCENFKTTRMPAGKRLREINRGKRQARAIREVLHALAANAPSPVTLAGLAPARAVSITVSRSMSLAEIPNATPRGTAPDDSFRALE
jgi:hypothetical protein